MERLCDLQGRRLIIACEPCHRRGLYDLDYLGHRFGPHACVYEVYIRLTQTCRYQHPVGVRRPNQYGRACRAQIELDQPSSAKLLPSRS